jgi:hypothetical protein
MSGTVRLLGAANKVRTGTMGTVVAGYALFDVIPIAVIVVGLTAWFERPQILVVVTAVALIVINVACCRWLQRHWDGWIAGNCKRIDAKLEKMCKGSMMKHPSRGSREARTGGSRSPRRSSTCTQTAGHQSVRSSERLTHDRTERTAGRPNVARTIARSSPSDRDSAHRTTRGRRPLSTLQHACACDATARGYAMKYFLDPPACRRESFCLSNLGGCSSSLMPMNG